MFHHCDPETNCMKTIALLIAALVGLAAGHAQPAYMNYQGRLLDPGGQPLINGSYTLQFDIYDAPTGGSLIWGPFRCDNGSGDGHTAKAIVANGRFNVILGPNDTAGRPLTTAFLEDQRFVEIRVSGGTPILPRQQFLSAPYALQSRTAQTALLSLSAQTAEIAAAASLASNLVQELAEALCPAGSIIAFGGDTNRIPSGWLLCNGQAVSRTGRAKLLTAIGTAWGAGDGSSTFNVPDLRGMFLRGLNGDLADLTWMDPDGNTRQSRNGGNSGNAVGSYQQHELKQHRHELPLESGGNLNIQSLASNIGTDERYGHPAGEAYGNYGGSETRPNNAYVNYIIKY
jgi:microcystin-dependent protein